MKQICIFLLAFFFFLNTQTFAQSLAINNDGSIANASALLDIKSTAKGVLVPRMSKAQKNTIAAPATGLMIFQDAPDSIGFYYYNGSAWLWMATATSVTGWATTGNAGTDTAINFIGTTTNMPLRFKVNNQWSGQFEPNNSNYFIGNNAGRLNTGIVNTAFGSFGLANNTGGNFNTAFGGGTMSSNTTGSSNVAMGNTTLANHKTGDNNVALGTNAMNADTAGTDNVAVGAFAMLNGKKSNSNTAVGFFSLTNTGINSTNFLEGSLNTALGYNSGKEIRRGFGNVAVGNDALKSDTSGTNNTAIGSNAATGFLGGSFNIAIGSFAMSTSRGSNKVAIGQSALNVDTSANGNIAVGSLAMRFNQRGVNNVAMGAAAMFTNISGSRNVAIGDSSLRFNSFAVPNGTNHFTNNTAVGYKTLMNNNGTSISEGINNVAIGSQALFQNITGSRNTAMGTEALFTNTASANTAIGFMAARSNTGGTDILAIGDSALFSNTLGTENISIGSRALKSNTTGDINIAIGKNALASNQLGSQNIAIGQDAMINMNLAGLSTITANVAIGYQALENVDPAAVVNSGNQNTAIGTRSGDAVTTGYYNTILGALSGGATLSTGFQNTLLGHSSTAGGDDNTQVGFSTSSSGDQNTLLGSRSNENGSLTNATAIGYRAEVAASNSLVLGSINGVNSATATVNVGVGTTTPDARFHVVKDSSVAGGIVHASAMALFENDNTGYIQMLNTTTAQAGLISGTSATTIRSGVFFNADSSVNFRSGGNANRMTLDNTGFVGVRTINPLSYLDVLGSTANAITVSNASLVLDEFDHTHIISNTAGAITITLPAANTCARREYVIVNQDNAVKTITSYLDFTGAANTSVPANTSITLQSNGTSWYRTR